MPTIVYAQRALTAAAYDTALINDLEGRGWTVQVETGALDAVDWSGVSWLIIGAPGTNFTSHVSSGILNAIDVPIVIFCRRTARDLGMSTGSWATTAPSWSRVATDDRAIFASLDLTAGTLQTLDNIAAGTTLIYETNIAGNAGVAEYFRDTYSRIFWGFHRFDLLLSGADMFTLWAKFVEDGSRSVTIGAVESDDTSDIAVQYVPSAGFLPTIDAIEDGDTAAFSATFIEPRFATIDATEDGDAAAFAATFIEPRFATIDAIENGDTMAASASNDWTSAITPGAADILYRCYLEATGLPTVEIPISSWQGTLQLDRSSYLQAVVPAVTSLYATIATYKAAAGQFVIRRVARLRASGFEASTELARAPMTTTRVDTGPTNATCTMSGYTTYTAGTATTLAMRDIRSTSLASGLRARCAIDFDLRPGDNAIIGGSTIPVAYINYYVNVSDAYMDVGERAL